LALQEEQRVFEHLWLLHEDAVDARGCLEHRREHAQHFRGGRPTGLQRSGQP
jgi:hypothetical protein